MLHFDRMQIRHVLAFTAALMVASLAPSHRAQAQTSVETQPIDPFGQEVTLTAKTIVYASGSGTWDTAFDTLVASFKALQAFLGQQGLKASGPAMTIYTTLDDTGFNYQAGIPLAAAPKLPPDSPFGVSTSPAGRALKFVHRGPFEATVSTYDAITHYLDEKQIEAQEVLVEEYPTDLSTTPEDKLVINIYIPVK
jgi:effector-binding domain-containing protein